MTPSQAAVLSTGTEILQGLYLDTNAQWLNQQLATLGISSVAQMAVPDAPGAVEGALRTLFERAPLVLMTGGLGPTEDDLTRHAVGRLFGCSFVQDEKAWAMIEERFRRRGRTLPPSNAVQAQVPETARVLHNNWGTAPGFVLEGSIDGKGQDVCLIALPGPPRENRPMFDAYLREELGRRFGGGRISKTRTLHTVGLPESQLNDMLREMFIAVKKEDKNDMAFLAGEARVDIRLTAHGPDLKRVDRELNELEEKARGFVPADFIYGRDAETLEGVVVENLGSRGLQLAVAESCTGGLVQKRLTDVAGASAVFRDGWVTYSNLAKQKRLGVKDKTLKKFGAVSEETVHEMARGALPKSGADVTVAVSGVAGPGGGSPEKPVGMVWYGLAWKPEKLGRGEGDIAVHCYRTDFSSSREMVRLFASHTCLDLVRRLILGLPLPEVPPQSV